MHSVKFGIKIQVNSDGKRGFLIRSVLISCISLVTYLIPVSSAFADNVYHVSKVEIEGTSRIDKEAVKAQLSAVSGAIRAQAISEDIQSLYNSGFFDQVSVAAIPVEGGKVLLRYTLVEKPVARKIFIKGNDDISEKDLAEVLRIEGKRFVDKNKLIAIMKRAKSFYQGHGFYDATLDYSTVPVGENAVDITFSIEEGKRYRVREIVLRGVSELDQDDIRSSIQTKRYKWWNSWLLGTGRVNKEMMDADKQIIKQYLLDHGRLEGVVGEASVEKRGDGLYVTYDIAEGAEYKIGAISASGDLVNNSERETLSDLKIEVGEIFNASMIREEIFAITDRFGDEGFAFANVVPNTELNRTSGTVDIDFRTARGKKVTINSINISGNEKTYDHVIRRWLTVEEQDTYAGSKIKRSQTLLQRLGYFDEVTIANKPTDRPDVVDLDVVVKEANTGSFSAGAGYSTANGTLFNTKISENNLFGTGRRVNLNLDFGSQISNQILSFDDARINDSWVSGGVDLFRTTRQFNDFDRDLAGGGMSVGYPLERIFGEWAQDINVNMKYDLQHVRIKDVEDYASQFVKDSEGKSIASSITPSLVRNTINNPLNPVRGSKQVLSVELAGLGGDQEYYLVEIRNSLFHPIWETSFGEFVLSDRTTFGFGESLDDDPFPLFKRFFPGGINSVRGYRNRTLGPEDENGREYGGSKQVVNNLELIFPLINSAGFRGVVFYDIGQAFDDNESIGIDQMRQGWGYGVRWMSPLGPIRVEFGYPINRQPGERGVQTMFSFGAPL